MSNGYYRNSGNSYTHKFSYTDESMKIILCEK